MGKRFTKIFEVVDGNKPWKVLRHVSTFISLLKSLGGWAKAMLTAPVGGIAIAAYMDSVPWWGRVIIGLSVCVLILWLIVLALEMTQRWKLKQPTSGPVEPEVTFEATSKLTTSRKGAIALVAVGTFLLLGFSGWLIIRYPRERVVYLTEIEVEALRLDHDNKLLRYEALRIKMAPLYKEHYAAFISTCKKIKDNLSDERIAANCRIDLDKKEGSLVVSPPRSSDGCFEYDPKQLYATKTITTLFSLGSFTILSGRNWPVSFESVDDANAFIALARGYTKACYVGGVHKPTMSDVIIRWPTKVVGASLGLCQDISSDRFTVLESDGIAYVMDAKQEVLQFDNVSEANLAIDMMRGRSSMCVVGGIPGVNARDPHIVGIWKTIVGDRVVYLN